MFKTQLFSIYRKYEICCKLFTPDNETVNNIIIGVHGFAGDKDSSMLETLAKEVCRKNTALICFDFPAHGCSPVGEDNLTVKNCKNDLRAVIDYASSKYPDAKKSVFATSFGGFITLLLADELADFALVLRAPAVTMPKVLLENVLNVSEEEFKKAGIIECGFERLLKLPYSFYEDLLLHECAMDNQLASKTLIIHGDRDNIVPLSDVEAFVASQSNVSLEIMRGADHRFKNVGEMEKAVELTIRFADLFNIS